ncbi:MAG: TIGR00266 family protein [Candidatus Omnitrophica bacterium]|nr:TIGR00266 family protein [Candidatus Omnitrophota bacterium]MCA9429719.1 TIGR00266 family protein [Candidatus Omnitrophota bacterium]
MNQWYLSYGGQQMGPYDLQRASEEARLNPDGFAWTEGFTEWKPIPEVIEFKQASAVAVAAPPPAPNQRADVIDFEIRGHEMQFVEIELDPGECAIAEAGAMMYKDPSIEMDSVFGDGSGKDEGSFMGKLLGAGKRLLTSESLFTTVFQHTGTGKAHVAFAAPYPGNVIPVNLQTVNGKLVCQKDSFLCAARGVSIGIEFQRKILTGLFGGEGFIMQKLEGDGLVFMHAGGTIVERQLGPGETLHVDTGCVVAYEGSVDMDIQQAGGIKTMLFGGEGLFFAILRGPGKVWLQSLPFSRLAGRMLMATRRDKGEGSVLGGLGGLIDGDNSF